MAWRGVAWCAALRLCGIAKRPWLVGVTAANSAADSLICKYANEGVIKSSGCTEAPLIANEFQSVRQGDGLIRV